jgi:hypothetical protein
VSALDQVLAAIRGHRFNYTNEDELQEGIAAAIATTGLDVDREVILSERDRIDLMVGTIGIEVKVAGSSAGVLEQLQRYAQHHEIEQLVLVTNKWQRLPAEAGGKPLTTISLATAGL